MSLKVVELNDRAIAVSDEGGVILQSPGFALVDGKDVHVGESAEQQARLNPTQSYNKYWLELNLEPISHGNNFRHYADIAYSHLLNLAETAGLDADVVFAVPGNFNRQQLSILLGLSQQCPFQVAGVVDTAVAAVSHQASVRPTIYADIQLHQTVLTPVDVVGNELTAGTTIQIPGVGSQNFMDLMMRLATDMFIQQCRFNPQHNAESEQQLYNTLPDWLAETEEGNLILELRAGETLHTAKMPKDNLIASLKTYFQKINEQIIALTNNSSEWEVLVTPALATLPGFLSSVAGVVKISAANAVHDACLHHRHLLGNDAGAINLITQLPVSAGAASEASVGKQKQAIPTHALFNNRAFPIANTVVANNPGLNGDAGQSAKLQLSVNGMPETLGTLLQHNDKVSFDGGELDYLLNQEAVSGESELQLGDRIQFQGSDDVITLIQVDTSR